MAEKKEIVVRATSRDGRGKNDARRARRNGQVPVTIYGGKAKRSQPWRRRANWRRFCGRTPAATRSSPWMSKAWAQAK